MNNQKLIAISKTILLILRILVILSILMVIIPWVFPTLEISKFMLSLQGFFGVINATHKSIDEFMPAITLSSKIFGFLGSAFTLLPLLLGIIIMIKLAKNYVNGVVFNLANAKSYQQLGVVYLISALLLQPISQILFYLCVTINNPAGQRVIAFGFGVDNLAAIFFAIVLIIIGQVMKLGHKISEEQELTI